jgi:SAM-dependent methyltransferase
MDEQQFYYGDWKGRLIGNKAREHLVLGEMRKLRQGDFFLEVGCSHGHFEKHAAAFSRNVFGAEMDAGKLKAAKRNCPGGNFAAANAEALPFKSNRFDFVLCTEVLEHVPDWKKALAELQRAGRKRILITIPLEKGIFWRIFSVFAPMGGRGHLHRLDGNDIRREMGKEWRCVRSEKIATPSRKLNRLLNPAVPERLAIFALLLFEKMGKLR